MAEAMRLAASARKSSNARVLLRCAFAGLLLGGTICRLGRPSDAYTVLAARDSSSSSLLAEELRDRASDGSGDGTVLERTLHSKAGSATAPLATATGSGQAKPRPVAMHASEAMPQESEIAARARGMVLGNLIGDAAATPNHWIYDTAKMAKHVESAKRGPAFCDPPGNPFYTTEPGAFSCYGDQTMCLLESLVACKGFDAADYAIRLQSCFGASSKYEIDATDKDNWPQLKANPKDADGKIIEEKRLWRMPVNGPWRHGSVKGFLTNRVVNKMGLTESGADDSQADCICKVPPLVALYGGTPALLPTVEKAIRVIQNTDTAVSFACGFARVLESLMLGKASSVREACDQSRSALEDPSKLFSTPRDQDVVTAFGVLEDLASVAPGDVQAKVQEILNLPFLAAAIA